MEQLRKEELLTHNMWVRISYLYPAGEYAGRFFNELKENGRIMAIKCPSCGRFHCPPRAICGRCHVRMKEWVEVIPKGTVLCYNIVEHSDIYPETGEMLKVPFTAGVITFDNARVGFTHYIAEDDPQKLHVGMRVEAVFKPKEQRKGNIHDIEHFRIIED